MTDFVSTFNKTNKKSKRGITLLEVVGEEQQHQEGELDLFKIAYKPYMTSEFIPVHIIPLLMKHHFPSSEIIHQFTLTHLIYKVKISEILGDNIRNWEYNRPPDLARCPDIASYIYNSKKPIDTMFWFVFTNKKNIFEVLDGIHRLTALKKIKEENSKPQDLLCPGDFGSNGDAYWLYEQYAILNIRFNTNFGERVEVFQNLNKSQAVPDLYIKDHKKEKIQIIDLIANEWQVNYKRHFSSSSEPNIGNTNRNKFVDLLDKIYDKYKIDSSNPNKLRHLLEDANNKIMNNIPSKVSLNTRVKCKETGCYLFIYKNERLEELI